MRMIDGKPEYKNGLVRKQGWGLGWRCPGKTVRIAGYEGQGPRGQVLALVSYPPACLGCADEGRSLRGLLQPVEGLYTVLCPLGPPHRPHLHLLGADEQGLQASFPQWLRQMRGLEPVCWDSHSPAAPTVSVPLGGLDCCPGPLYLFSLHSVVPSSTVKDFGLSYPCSSLPFLS